MTAHTSYSNLQVHVVVPSFLILGKTVGAGQVKESLNLVKLSVFSSLLLYCLIVLVMRLLKGFLADQFAMDGYRGIYERLYDYGSIFLIFGDVF